MTVINTNVKSLVAQNAATVNERSLSKAMQQLSTGKRINGAADDAAGLAISSKMTSQIKGLNQAVRNANDGISMAQTAEGALVEVTNMMQRMRELAVQSANDTNTPEDREALDLEYQELMKQINQIGDNTQWNGMNILDKSFGSNSGKFSFQVGANANQTIDLTIQDFRTTASAVVATVATDTTADVQTSVYDITDLNAAYDAAIALDATDVYALENTTLSVNINGKQLQVTIDKDLLDTVDGTTTDLAELVGEKFDEAFVAEFGADSGLTFTDNGDGTFDIDSDGDVATAFTTSIAVNDGALSALGGTDIAEQSTANSAIGSLDTALKVVNQERASMGATINRLTYAADNLNNIAQNTTESRSRILDTDYAQTTTELARAQIISQAATAMLAQANQSSQSVLSLLR